VIALWYLGLNDLSSTLHRKLRWTLAERSWTIGWKSSLLVRSGIRTNCKSAIAVLVADLRRQVLLVRRRFVRYGSLARAVGGRVNVPHRAPSAKFELRPAQQRALLALGSEPGASLARSEYERLTAVSRSQAAHDLSELVSAGLLVRVGGGPSTRYVLAHEPATQRRWTPDRIRRELETFCAERSTWPTPGEFKTAGHGDLYVAASRYGGVAHWAEELGLERIAHSRTAATAAHTPLRSRLTWAFAGALATVCLAAVAATVVLGTHRFGSSGKTGSRASAPSLSTRRGVFGLLDPLHLRAAATQIASADARPRVRRHVGTSTPRRTPRVQSQPAQRMTLVSNTVEVASVPTAPATSTTSSTAPHSTGPTPLPAPPGSSAPSPLKAP